jgi:acyl-coenzyme A thioesterase PaaI-like protein
MTLAELNDFLEAAFPGKRTATVEQADGKAVRVRLVFDDTRLRPGGTVSGPTMMAPADTVMYALVLSAVGKVPLAVTTDLSINFLRNLGLET